MDHDLNAPSPARASLAELFDRQGTASELRARSPSQQPKAPGLSESEILGPYEIPEDPAEIPAFIQWARETIVGRLKERRAAG